MSKLHPDKNKKHRNRGTSIRRRDKTINSQPQSPKSSSTLWLYGVHAVRAALENPNRRIDRLVATPEALKRLGSLTNAQHQMRNVETVTRTDIDEVIGPNKVHQGLALQVAPLATLDLAEILDRLSETEPALFIVLDQITDPHNVGAILRSAAAFGAQALITTRHNAPEETGALAKSACGAMESTPLLHVTNLKRAFKDCQPYGFWSVALDASANDTLDQLDLPPRCIMVFGAEGKGIRPGVRQNCDFEARLPITKAAESLNVSNAAAISMYEWRRRKH